MAQRSCTIIKKRGIVQRIPRALVYRCVRETIKRHARANQKKSTLTVVFVTTEEMRSLNRDYHKDFVPTDVLSFASDKNDIDNTQHYLGEVVICPAFIARHKKNPAAFRYEVCHLAVHGTLHLLGFHHEDDEQGHERLHAREERILEALGPLIVAR